jgi:hypothetical protein
VVVADCPHHVVRRGVRRMDVFCSADDRQEYLDQLEQLIATSLRRKKGGWQKGKKSK